MAQSATRLPEEDRADISPDLGPGHNQAAGDASDPRTERTAAGDASDPRESVAESPSALRDSEESAGSSSSTPSDTGDSEKGDSGFSFNPQDPKDRGNMGKVLQAAGKNKKKVLFFGGGAAGIAASIAALFLMLIPLKIEHIVTNLEHRFSASTEQAVGNETENMLSNYIKRYVLPGLTKCSGTTIDKNCNALFNSNGSNNPVDTLFQGWKDARLENKLAVNYGIEFKAVKHGSVTKYYMKGPGVGNPNGDDITAFGVPSDNKDLFQEVSRGQARQGVRNALENETKWKQVMYRFKIGRLLEEKYGIKRCIIFCGTRDGLTEFKSRKVNVAQVFIAQRALIPLNDAKGIVVTCIISTSCDPEKTQSTAPTAGTTAEGSGAPENPETDTQIRTDLEALAANYGKFDKAAIDQMVKDYKDMSDKGFSKYLIDKVLTKIGLGAFSDGVSGAIPIVGWVTKASNAITTVSTLGPKVKKLDYVTNAPAMVSMFMMYRTFADEIHTGNVDPTQVGQLVSSLGPGNPGNSSDPEVGGTATAESTPLYSSVIDGKTTPSSATSLLQDILPARAYAAGKTNSSNSSSDYKCGDGKPVPAGKLLCSEEILGQGGNSITNSLSSFFNLPGISIITSAAGVISAAGGVLSGILGSIFSAISHIPIIGGAINDVSSLFNRAIEPIYKSIINDLIPNPFGSNMSGGRKVDLMAGGAATAGKDACEQIGCQVVPSTVAANIINQQQSEAHQSFAHQSFFARMFSTDSQYSMVSQIAMSTPISIQTSFESSIGRLTSNPLSVFTKAFASIFPSPHVFAYATPDNTDPFRIGTTAYPVEKIPADPHAYWDSHNCGDTSSNGPIAQWQQAASNPNGDPGKDDPNTGMPVHRDVEPCLLIQEAASSAGGSFDSNNLSQDDLADINQGSSTPNIDNISSVGVSGNAQQLAQQILSNHNIDLSSFSASVLQDIQNAAAGKPGTAGTNISTAVLKLIATVGQSHKVLITAIESNGQGHASGSYHYTGDAVDFGSFDGISSTGRDSGSLAIIKIATGILPSGTGIGQAQCGLTPSLPSGWSAFDDSCNHLHIQVPRGTQ